MCECKEGDAPLLSPSTTPRPPSMSLVPSAVLLAQRLISRMTALMSKMTLLLPLDPRRTPPSASLPRVFSRSSPAWPVRLWPTDYIPSTSSKQPPYGVRVPITAIDK